MTLSAGTAPIASPYAIDGRGRTAETTPGQHITDLIEMVLFTAPGERVMRPTFGSGLLGLVFAPTDDSIAATTQLLIAGALTDLARRSDPGRRRYRHQRHLDGRDRHLLCDSQHGNDGKCDVLGEPVNGTTLAHEERLALVRESGSGAPLNKINGIDFIDVDPADEGTLFVSFVFDVNTTVDPTIPTAVGSALSAGDFAVLGGERITPVSVQKIARVGSNQIAVTVAPVGDFSIYTLQIGTPPDGPPGFDPMLCAASFIFHVECAKRFDCKQSTICPPTVVTPPPIDYMAKDYPAFVAVMLDRLALLAPRWTERHAADLGVAVVEVLAYVADQLSYRHDVVDTEAYLETARLRTSVRRHARLVDYRIGDGSNARVWLALTLNNDLANGVPRGNALLHRVRRRDCARLAGDDADLPGGDQRRRGVLRDFGRPLYDRRAAPGGAAGTLRHQQRDAVLQLERDRALPADRRDQCNARRRVTSSRAATCSSLPSS